MRSIDSLVQLDPGPDRFRASLAVRSLLCAGDGRLFGGSAIAAAILAAERATGETARTMTLQFVGSSRVGDQLNLSVVPVKLGKRFSHINVLGQVGDRCVLSGLGLLGDAVPQPRAWRRARVVPPPDDCQPRIYRLGDNSNSIAQALDVRMIPGGPTPETLSSGQHGVTMLWARLRDVDEVSAAALGLLSDHVALGFREVIDEAVQIVTLAATVRLAFSPSSSWTLLETRIEAIGDTLGLGTADIWSEDGIFLGSAAQTLALLRP